MTAPEPTRPADEHTDAVALDLDAIHETICDNFTGMAEVQQAADLLVAEVQSLRANWRMVTTALGYGDGITEPQIEHRDFVAECERQFAEASECGKRDAWNATGGRCTSVMVHTNPEQTPEAYAAELDAWWNEHKAARREAQR